MEAAVAPVRLPHLVQSAWYGLAPYSFFDHARRRHGDVFSMHVIGQDWTIVADPGMVREIFTGDPEVLYSGEANEALRGLIGTRNVLLLDGGEHMRRRKLLLPKFHGERMQAYRAIMTEATDRELEHWPQGRAEPALGHTQAITFEVILRAVFGLDDAARLGPFGQSLRHILDWVQSPRVMVRFLRRGPEGVVGWEPFERLIEPLDREILDEIARRREADDLGEREDILSLLLLARDEEGEALPDRDVRDELLTLLTAGHETTAATLAWALHFVARDPAAQERLRAGEEGFADAVVQETLRLRPAVPLVVRKLKAPVEIGGRVLPEGTTVAPSSVLIHRDPGLYPEPEAFRPDRFVGVKPGTYEWIPFGGGVRRCLGAAFAQLEARIVLERIAQRFAISAPSARWERIGRRGIVLIPHRRGRVILQPL